ncbi:MAG: CotH kinase family protein, partial [Clostridia bacterium]|nr:CotH kinase family protein [Clostridia bacterium]
MKTKIYLGVVAVVFLLAFALCSCSVPEAPITDPITDPITEPITDPVTDPVTKPVTEPVTDPATDPITEPVTEPVTDPVTEPVTELVTEPVTDPATEPITEPVPEPVSSSLIPQVYITASGDINRDAYIPCTVKVYDPSGVYSDIYDTESTIKIRGNSTSSGEKSPWNIKFSSKVELLGLGKGKKWSLLSNMYDKTQLRNKLAYDFALDVGISYTSSSTFAEVYLNGEYRGIYQICEPVDVSKTQVDIDTDNNEYLLEVEPYVGYAGPCSVVGEKTGIMLTFNEPEEPDVASQQWVKGFISGVEDALLSGDYARVLECVDVDSFAKNYVVQELFKNVDYPRSSTRFYIKGGKLYEGPVWDFDLSSGNCSSDYYPYYNNVETSGLSYEGIFCVSLFNKYLF